MNEIDRLTDSFKIELEIFINGCDQKENDLKWDREEFGEMEAFYQNDLISFVINLMFSDGQISEREAEYLNKTFGCSYSVEELCEIHDFLQSELEEDFDDHLVEDVRFLLDLDAEMGKAFVELLLRLCDIIAQSDDRIDDAERQKIDSIRERLEAL